MYDIVFDYGYLVVFIIMYSVFYVHCRGQAPAYSLGVKTHNKALIDKTADLNEHNFLINVLYKDYY